MSDGDPLALKALLYEGVGPARHWCSLDSSIHPHVLKYHCDIMRCLLGNPHCSISVSRMAVRCPDCGDIPEPWCDDCSGDGTVDIPIDCITAEVVSLAQTAYDERPARTCKDCKGKRVITWPVQRGDGEFDAKCVQCDGTGRIEGGTLAPERLSVLADALEEAGCPITCLVQCDTCWEYRWDEENPYGIGYLPERDVASGRYEGGWTNCKTCNCGGPGYVKPGLVYIENPILTHLRGPGPHWRGCCVIDEILGRK